ncbi:SRPBCC family protein [Flexivirga meconopsidis]|uniref:SRPBCC family protein n=1 Tax=Flexivirga meconopsidis TaxID=2977121 RepID=UPI00223F9534|nr:SRPBCC domain-containing protein [Flexivirga meconopsidis]
MPEQLHVTHEFRTSRQRLFRAFVDPAELAAWFGPEGFHVPEDSVTVEPRQGGAWRLTMVADDNPELKSPVEATLTEFTADQTLVGTEQVTGFPGLEDGTAVTLRLEFADAPAGTQLSVTQGPFPDDMVEQAKAGWESSFGKLEKLVSPPS